MEEENKGKNVNLKKKKTIIVLLGIFGLALLVLIGFVIGTLIFNFMQKNQAPQDDDKNIMSQEENEGDDILKVNLKEEVTPSPEVVEPTPTPEVDAPYYIKINYTANVVTVYKKDASRKTYSAN